MMNRTIILLIVWLTGSFTQGNLAGQSLLESWKRHHEMERQSLFSQIEWVSAGPSFQGGRVETVDAPLNQPEVIYAGFGSGGLWKSSNQGFSWELIFSDPSYSIGDVAVSQSHHFLLMAQGADLLLVLGS